MSRQLSDKLILDYRVPQSKQRLRWPWYLAAVVVILALAINGVLAWFFRLYLY